jgi:hypothetical protein
MYFILHNTDVFISKNINIMEESTEVTKSQTCKKYTIISMVVAMFLLVVVVPATVIGIKSNRTPIESDLEVACRF